MGIAYQIVKIETIPDLPNNDTPSSQKEQIDVTEEERKLRTRNNAVFDSMVFCDKRLDISSYYERMFTE